MFNKERKIILEYGTITLYGSSFQSDSFNKLPKCSPSEIIIQILFS